MPVVWTDAHRSHQPGGEVWIGLPYGADEVPERAEAIRDALQSAGAPVVDAAAARRRARSSRCTTATSWASSRRPGRSGSRPGYPDDPGQDNVVAYIFPHPGLVGPHEPLLAASASARVGNFAFDTMTPVGPGTWEAARGAVDCALTACDLVLGRRARPPTRARARPGTT